MREGMNHFREILLWEREVKRRGNKNKKEEINGKKQLQEK